MNRRSFIADMLKAGVACTFLLGAGRIWKPTYERITVVSSRLYLDELFRLMYEIKRHRERAGIPNEIILDRYLLTNFSGPEEVKHMSRFAWPEKA